MKEISENVKAIDVVRQMVADGQVSKDVAEKYFPELKDSEDERIRKSLIDMLKNDEKCYLKEIAWLEKQGEQKHQYKSRPRYVGEEELLGVNKQGEQKPAWGEEDEKYVKDLAAYFTEGLPLRYAEVDIADWLKDLRDRSTWKPSDEQIMALRWVLNHIPYDSHKEEISGLLEQLKKLK